MSRRRRGRRKPKKDVLVLTRYEQTISNLYAVYRAGLLEGRQRETASDLVAWYKTGKTLTPAQLRLCTSLTSGT